MICFAAADNKARGANLYALATYFWGITWKRCFWSITWKSKSELSMGIHGVSLSFPLLFKPHQKWSLRRHSQTNRTNRPSVDKSLLLQIPCMCPAVQGGQWQGKQYEPRADLWPSLKSSSQGSLLLLTVRNSGDKVFWLFVRKRMVKFVYACVRMENGLKSYSTCNCTVSLDTKSRNTLLKLSSVLTFAWTTTFN